MDHITPMDRTASTREAFIAGLMDVAPDDPAICLVSADRAGDSLSEVQLASGIQEVLGDRRLPLEAPKKPQHFAVRDLKTRD